MKRLYELVNELREVGPEGEDNAIEVVIGTDKQLLPNTLYDFEVEVQDGRVVLRPTVRQ